MPVRPLASASGLGIDLTTAGRFTLVEAGNVINGLNLAGIPAGVAVYLVLGANPRIGPMFDGPVWFGPGSDPDDVSNGVWLETDTNYPGVRVGGFVSFVSPRAIGADRGGVAQSL